MQRYIFVTNQYYPNPGATGVCVHAIAKKLALEGFEVHVICYNTNREELVIDGVRIHKVTAPIYLRDLSTSSVLLRRFQRFVSLLAKLIYLKKYPLRSLLLSKRLYYLATKYVENDSDVKLISTYTPIEACWTLLRIKEKFPKIKTIFYSTDTLSNEKGNSGILSSEKRESLGRKWEKNIFSSVNAAIIMECHKEHYMSEAFREFHKKMRLANFPLLARLDNEGTVKLEKKKKTLLYAGTLYKSLRNPSFLCELLIRINKYLPIEAIFMGGGDCVEIMNAYVRNSVGAIQYLGMQSHNVVEAYLKSADILLSIGNSESPMAPSKIFEYMSTGKPVIHVYSWAEDPCVEPLKKYGNALLVEENNDIQLEKVIDFVSKSKFISFEEVAKRFETATPEYTANIIKSI